MIALLTDPWFEAEFYGNIKAEDPSGRGASFLCQGEQLDGAQGLKIFCPCGYGKPVVS